MLLRSITSLRFRKSAGMATSSPVTTVAKDGVRYFGWMREKMGGSNPSRLMLIQMRGWRYWKKINDRADWQRIKNSPRNITLRVLALLGCCGKCVETNKRPKDCRDAL